MQRMSLLASAVMCGLVFASPAQAQDYAFFSANLFGSNVPEGEGVDEGSADFNAEADFAEGQLCYYLEIYDLRGADTVNIREGEDGKKGPAVVSLSLPGSDADEVCIAVDGALLQSIAEKPDSYYIAIGTPTHPDEAIRGQIKG